MWCIQVKTLFERFKVLEYPRDIRGKRYKLIDILMITTYSILCSLKDFTNIERLIFEITSRI